MQIVCIWYNNSAGAIKAEGLSHLARRESHATLQCPVVTVLNVISVAVARPPTHHVWRRRNARFAFTRAAGIDNRLDFRLRKRATEDFYFVDLTHPKVPIGWTRNR